MCVLTQFHLNDEFRTLCRKILPLLLYFRPYVSCICPDGNSFSACTFTCDHHRRLEMHTNAIRLTLFLTFMHHRQYCLFFSLYNKIYWLMNDNHNSNNSNSKTVLVERKARFYTTEGKKRSKYKF